jgi:hypothetical protein
MISKCGNNLNITFYDISKFENILFEEKKILKTMISKSGNISNFVIFKKENYFFLCFYVLILILGLRKLIYKRNPHQKTRAVIPETVFFFYLAENSTIIIPIKFLFKSQSCNF